MFDISQNLTNYKSILRNLKNKFSTQIVGCADTAKLIILGELFNNLEKTILIVAKEDNGEKIYDYLKYFGIAEDNILFFPTLDCQIYNNVKPDFGTIGERLFALKSLSLGPKIIICPTQSLLWPIMPKDVLDKSIINIKKEQEIELSHLEKKLISLGYSKGEVCDHRGIYSIRGSLIDVFPSNEESPLRINLDWDCVSEIKYFDTETQRTNEHIDNIFIYPTREVLYDFLDDSFIEKISNSNKKEDLQENTNNDIEKMKEHIFFNDLEYYMPYIYNNYVWNYLPQDSLICFDMASLEKDFNKSCEEFYQTARENKKRGYLYDRDINKINENLFKDLAMNWTSFVFSDFELTNWEFIPKKEYIYSENIESYEGKFNEFIRDLEKFSKKETIIFATASAFRMDQILSEYNFNPVICNSDISLNGMSSNIIVTHAPIDSGVYFPKLKLRIFSDREIFGIKRGKKVRKLLKDAQIVKSYLDLKKNDYVVHEDYGVSQYLGIEQKEVLGVKSDFLTLQYANTILYVSISGFDKIQKYIGGEGKAPKLSKLGGGDWEKVKTKAKKKIYEIAKELVELYAWRQKVKGYTYEKDTKWQKEMEEAFPYKETKSQLRTINEVKADLESDKPMDRLVCGDVGFGKTEVAIRAAFKVALEGKQVALLAPTTILAEQHYRSFKERLAPYPQRIELLNRFKTNKEAKEIVKDLNEGKVHIVIGTHRILSKDVSFSNLGLIIIDEEQRFGVKHKETLKNLKKNVDVLSLSATPIPRTLNMSLSGIRTVSFITDPPEGRVPIKTYVKPYEKELIKNAVARELARGGQVFFVHNRVEDIYTIAEKMEILIPDAKIDVAHGQMNEKDLEEVMMDFYKGDINLLICTTIIENGIDVSNANTIIIDNADKLGMAQLYQLRGRVGRVGKQAYAYLLYRNSMTEEGAERLKALQEFSDLGSGFRVAERDLEIRGAGNLLGKEQSGNIEGIGFEYYCRLLNEMVEELKGNKTEEIILPKIELNIDTYIPDDYIEAESLRIMFYKKFAQVNTNELLENVIDEMEDRFGKLPKTCANMAEILKLKLKAQDIGVESISPHNNLFVAILKDFKIPTNIVSQISGLFPDYQLAQDRIFFTCPKNEKLETTNELLDTIPKIKKEVNKKIR